MCSMRDSHRNGWVSPFGHPRIKVCCRLPEAYRRLPRPSSPSAAKASTECACSLDHITEATLTPPSFSPKESRSTRTARHARARQHGDEHSPDFTRDRDDPRRPRPQRGGPNRRADALFNFKLVSISLVSSSDLSALRTRLGGRAEPEVRPPTPKRETLGFIKNGLLQRTAKADIQTRGQSHALGSRLPLFARWWSRGGSNS